MIEMKHHKKIKQKRIQEGMNRGHIQKPKKASTGIMS